MLAVMMFVMIPRAAASAERIQAVLDTDPEIADPIEPVALPETEMPGLVEFENVSFSYPGAEDCVLEDLTFSLQPGQMTAIVGGTGSGKTTLINLIPRLYDVTGGRVLVDGVDVRDLAQAQLWEQIALVPQKAFLFTGTIGSNVRFGAADADELAVWRALDTAQAGGFVRELPEQLDAPIDQGGANVSGGQRQRLAIARALVRRSPIYLFDDSFSALDYVTDAKLRAALRREVADATVVIVAQRVSTILHADQIIVLDDGRVVGIGTHAELMMTCETYQEIVHSQVTEEEVA